MKAAETKRICKNRLPPCESGRGSPWKQWREKMKVVKKITKTK